MCGARKLVIIFIIAAFLIIPFGSSAFAKATKYPFPPLDTGCVFTGTLADYAVERGAIAVDMELSTHKHTDFKKNLEALKILLNWEK